MKLGRKFLSGWAVGLPKIFGVSCFKLQTWDWPKSWRYTKFQVPPGVFDHVPRAPKLEHLQACWPVVGHLRSSGDVVKRPRRDLKLGIPSGFGPISSLEFEAWDPEKFGQPYCTLQACISHEFRIYAIGFCKPLNLFTDRDQCMSADQYISHLFHNLLLFIILLSLTNNRIVREGPGPRGIWGRVQGVGLVQGVTRSGLVCDTPSARSADAREARFLVESSFKTILWQEFQFLLVIRCGQKTADSDLCKLYFQVISADWFKHTLALDYSTYCNRISNNNKLI